MSALEEKVITLEDDATQRCHAVLLQGVSKEVCCAVGTTLITAILSPVNNMFVFASIHSISLFLL